MKGKIIVVVLSMLIFLNITSQSLGGRDPHPAMIELLHAFHEASDDLISPFSQSISLFEKTFESEPNVQDLKNASVELSNKIEQFDNASEALAKFINTHEKDLKISESVLKKIKKDSSKEMLSKFRIFSEAFKEFAESTKEIEFTVYANESWANSGLKVEQDDLIWVDAKGQWRVSSTSEMVDWKGYPCKATGVYNINKKAPLGSLLYRVRGSSNPIGYALEENKRARIGARGRLEFVINDTDVKNNQGMLDLTIVLINGEKLRYFINQMKEIPPD